MSLGDVETLIRDCLNRPNCMSKCGRGDYCYVVDGATDQVLLHAHFGFQPDECRRCGEEHSGEQNSVCGRCLAVTSHSSRAVRVDDGNGCVERVHPSELEEAGRLS